jgi:hypothetical protein
VAGAEGKDIAPAAALEVARRLGAGRVIDGSVVGTPAHLTVTASLLTAPEGRDVARASVEGPADSISALVDRLTARLLLAGSKLPASSLAARHSRQPVPTWRAGQRSGREAGTRPSASFTRRRSLIPRS